MRRAHRRHRLVLQTLFLKLCETYEAKTARAGSSAICAGSSAICAGTVASLGKSDATIPAQTRDATVSAQMADEPARAVLASYVSHN